MVITKSTAFYARRFLNSTLKQSRPRSRSISNSTERQRPLTPGNSKKEHNNDPNWKGDRKVTNEEQEAFDEMYDALVAFSDLMQSLWESVPWGQTSNLDVTALNTVPGQAQKAILRATPIRERKGGQ